MLQIQHGSRCHMAWCTVPNVRGAAPRMRGDSKSYGTQLPYYIIYPERGVYVHARPLIGSNSQCAVASNQNSMAEGASLLAKTQHVWG